MHPLCLSREQTNGDVSELNRQQASFAPPRFSRPGLAPEVQTPLESSEADIYLAMTYVMIRRLAPDS
jgi:hypothetical protein